MRGVPAAPNGAAGALLRCRRASPALEFALLAPVMIAMLTGTYDVTQLLIAQSRVIGTAQQIVEIATELSIQPDQSLSLTPAQAYQAQTAIYATMPQLKSGADTSQYSVTLSAVVFTATPTTCTQGVNCRYVAHTAWSTSLPRGTRTTRPCGVIAQVAATAPPSITTLPTAGMTALTSIVVADVVYVYRPLFSSFITGPVTLRRTALVPPRTGSPQQYVQYDVANAAADAAVCPGYL